MVEFKQLTATEFRNFQKFIYEHSGIRLPETKRTLLSNRIRRRLKAGEFESYESYYRYLTSSSGLDELTEFFDVVTTNETFFFRTENHFQWFRTEFINEIGLQARSGDRERRLKIWSAACSTGEEPYSVAMCLAENQLRLRDWQLKVIGTDLSATAVKTAREGIFAERALQNLDEKRRKRYFTKLKNESRWQIKSSLQEMVSFRQHNLLQPSPESAFDCVFIRNVLIYFDRDSKRRVVANLVQAMADGGYLVVGPSEGIFDMLSDLTKHSTFLYQK